MTVTMRSGDPEKTMDILDDLNDGEDQDSSLEDILGDSVDEDDDRDPDQDEDEDDPEPEKIEEKSPEEIVNVKVTRPRRRRQSRSQSYQNMTKQSMDDYIEGLDPGSSTKIKLRLNRIEPTHFGGESVDGFLERFDRKVTVEEIKKTFGGGTYDLVFSGPKENGMGNKYITSKRIRIAGDPIIRRDEATKAGKEDPGIVKMALGTQEKMLEGQDRKIEQERNRADKMMEMVAAKNNAPSEVMPLLIQMMQQNQTQAQAQLEVARDESRRREEESKRKEERLERTRSEDRKEMEQKSKSDMLPMMTFMVEQMKMSESKSKESAEMMRTMMASQQQMMAGTFKTQMDMQNQASSQQVEFMKLQMSSIRDELKESRKNNNTDVVSMLLKVKDMKSALADVTGETEATQTTLDKVMERIPEISEGVSAVAATLFASMKPKAQAQIAAPSVSMPKKIQVDSAPPITMPAKVDVLPAAPEASEEPKQEEKQPDESEAIQNMEYPNDPQEALAVMIIKLTDSMNRDVDPADFVRDNMMGKIDREMLIQLSSLPAFALVQNICSPLESDHPLQDARGKSYIKDVLAALKVGLTEE